MSSGKNILSHAMNIDKQLFVLKINKTSVNSTTNWKYWFALALDTITDSSKIVLYRTVTTVEYIFCGSF